MATTKPIDASSDCPYPGCFFCLMRDVNPSKRRPSIAKLFKDLPGDDDDGQVIPISGLWNSAMSQPSNPEFVDLGVFECMAALIWKGLTNRRWLAHDQNIFIPYYAAHIIGSYTMVVEEFAERAVSAGVIPALLELLRGRMTWVEQRVAVRALGHLASYDSTFPYIAAYGEILELAMQLSVDAPELVYTHFFRFVDKRLGYHCDLLTRGVGGIEVESRNAESWASQLQCWSLQLINCFAFKEEFLATICQPDYLVKLAGTWGGLANENSPAGVGLIRTLCHRKLGKRAVADCDAVIETLCNVSRSSDDWQHMAVDCLVWLIQDADTRFKVLDRALPALIDLAELPSVGEYKTLGNLLVQHLVSSDHEPDLSQRLQPRTRSLLKQLQSFQDRVRFERNLPREDVQIRLAAALVSKLEGNAYFSAEDIQAAAAKYTEALTLCPIKARKERVTLYSNRAQCQLLLQNPDAAVSDTTRALCIHNPVNRHGKSLWRRSQAYDCLGLAKESLLDAILFVNECFGDGEAKNSGKVPRYVDQLIKKQMQSIWLFSDAAAKHGGIVESEADDDERDERDYGSGSGLAENNEGLVSGSGDQDESEWETASESDDYDERGGNRQDHWFCNRQERI